VRLNVGYPGIREPLGYFYDMAIAVTSSHGYGSSAYRQEQPDIRWLSFPERTAISSAQLTSRELHYYKRYDKLVRASASLKSVHPITLPASMKQLQNLRNDLHRI